MDLPTQTTERCQTVQKSFEFRISVPVGERVGDASFDKAISDPDDENSDVATSTVSVCVQELLDADFGLYVWPAATVMAAFLARDAAKWCQGQRVLELGAGTGLVGLVCAKCGATQVTLTDHADNHRVLANLRNVVKLNGIDKVGNEWLYRYHLFPLQYCLCWFVGQRSRHSL